jgi:transcriptional regulator with XRE-family HTH domain
MEDTIVITRAKIAIDKSGLKQRHIAKQIGMDDSLMSHYVSGNRKLPIDVAKKIAKVLKVPVSTVIEEEEGK